MSSPPTHVSRSAEPSTTSGDGGLVLRLYIEPQFSYVTDSLIYGSLSGSTLRTIDQYDFSTGAYSRLLDLDSLVPACPARTSAAWHRAAAPSSASGVYLGSGTTTTETGLLWAVKASPLRAPIVAV